MPGSFSTAQIARPPSDLAQLFQRRSRAQTELLAVATLRALMLLTGGTFLLGALLSMSESWLAAARLCSGSLLLLATALAQLAMRRQRYRTAAYLLTALLALVLSTMAIVTRSGLTSVALPGVALMISLSGALLGRRVTIALTLWHAASLLVIFELHQIGRAHV